MTSFQNFSVTAGDALDVTFDLDPTDNISLDVATVYFQAYSEFSGVADGLSGPVIAKDSATGGITIIQSPDQFIVHLQPVDTANLLANYRFEALIIDADNNPASVTKGIMTVTESLTLSVISTITTLESP